LDHDRCLFHKKGFIELIQRVLDALGLDNSAVKEKLLLKRYDWQKMRMDLLGVKAGIIDR